MLLVKRNTAISIRKIVRSISNELQNYMIQNYLNSHPKKRIVRYAS